ncbi:Protein of unknown function DUF1635 [Macleaya cordata]|uniref:Uncharacterized protein n=1 Tax=Macleaya cordata TaxID=56857 RepID=A0A200RA20_MACCD|nr:Protein of unknown function DUF1635 [Macleaya cordata]
MENQGNAPLSWAYYYQGKSMEELRQSLLYTTLELETTRLAAQEEIRKREDQIIQLEDLLSRAITERDEAQEKCQRLLMDKLVLFQQPQQTTPLSGISSIEDEQRRGGDSNTAISSSDCEESIVSSPAVDPFPPPILQVSAEKPLPEKGKLLQAVMKAGPLLQTLLLAGPLPQWQHPPPPLNSFEIPPVIIPSSPLPPPHLLHIQDTSTINMTSPNNNNNCGSFNNKKRSLVICEGSDISSTNPKYQRTALH